MRDLQTMARRVRGYVIHSKTRPGLSTTPQRATTPERKALATMGRKGGQRAAERWKTHPATTHKTSASDWRRQMLLGNAVARARAGVCSL
ncbi:hypothetical protein [Corynebacterium pseudokroppenstedtii]|uniref:hypothetical protein n=1 Tax=Corynebacterium pseudokroppenstedtii TaxID=2804917 RepID=UPI0030795274